MRKKKKKDRGRNKELERKKEGKRKNEKKRKKEKGVQNLDLNFVGFKK